MFLRLVAPVLCSVVLTSAGLAQTPSSSAPDKPMDGMSMQDGKTPDKKPLPSPAASATVTLGGKSIAVRYNAPSARGRSIMGGVVPFGKVWRTGANPATTLVTAANLTIGTLTVPAGTYTLYTLPGADTWMLIINKQTGQWGTVYNQDQDLGRTPLTSNPLASPQEVMSISFENTKGKSTELHIKWEKADEFVTVTAQ